MSTQPGSEGNATRSALALGALGVVFGDIGTSPLYALRECLHALPDVERTEGVLGALSLVFWALVFEVVIKYLTFVTRADNRGEGGIFALLALSSQGRGKAGAGIGKLTLLILFGAALLYGDGIITPAISVLGAAEGLKSFNPDITEKHVMLIACVVLAGLFAFQRSGTKAIGRIFGPAMCVWFIVLGGLGLWNLAQAPQVLAALNPMYGVKLLLNHPTDAIPLLGAVVLVITGAEALYADMGHFGRKAIARAWYFGAFPGLVLNYFGQGAYALAHPHDPTNPFFALVPEGSARLVLTGLSIMAAIIASQAMISGTFSLTRQAIQLGYFPRLLVRYTNPDQSGQIYLPLVNTLLAVGSLLTVLMFRSSNNLAAAYGIAVTGTMVVTTIAFFNVLIHNWKWPILGALGLTTLFLIFDVLLFSSNLPKLFDGGWFPIAIAVGMMATMHTWKKGKQEIFKRVYANEITEDELRNIAGSERISRVRGTSVFMAGNPSGTPLVLLHHVKANKVLHETVVLLSIVTDEVPTVPAPERLNVREIGEGVWRAIARYGYMESPDVSAIMEEIRSTGVPVKLAEATYYFNREMIIAQGTARMPQWQKHYYAFLSRNARTVRDYYNLPPMQIIEVGLPIQL
ncbi:MAG TPA: KUP/HAK/KT family potassium transporter [Opitutaceae bacterium]|nr:KUP/HAK/KT family potassium transporter [Opitutaceae bacterium]